MTSCGREDMKRFSWRAICTVQARKKMILCITNMNVTLIERGSWPILEVQEGEKRFSLRKRSVERASFCKLFDVSETSLRYIDALDWDQKTSKTSAAEKLKSPKLK